MKKYLNLLALLCVVVLFGFKPSAPQKAKFIIYNQVKSVQAPAGFLATVKKTPQLKRGLILGQGNRVTARKGFKLYKNGNAIVLLNDANDNLGSKIKGKASGIGVDVKFVFIRFACACKLGGGTGGCMVKLNQDLNTVCESAGCSECGVGIELWGPDGKEIIDFISPF